MDSCCVLFGSAHFRTPHLAPDFCLEGLSLITLWACSKLVSCGEMFAGGMQGSLRCSLGKCFCLDEPPRPMSTASITASPGRKGAGGVEILHLLCLCLDSIAGICNPTWERTMSRLHVLSL